MDVTIRIEGNQKILLSLKSYQSKLRKVLAHEVATFTRVARKDIIDNFYPDQEISRQTAQLFKIRSRRRRKRLKGTIWFGRNDVNLKFVGLPIKTKGGLIVNSRFYAGAFVAKFKSGGSGIFRKEGGRFVPVVKPIADQQGKIAKDVVKHEHDLKRRIENELRVKIPMFR